MRSSDYCAFVPEKRRSLHPQSHVFNELWESKCMEREDQDAREPPQETLCDTPDSAMSCLSAADSTTSRRPKLDTLVCSTVQRGMNSNQVAHLRGVKRTAQKRKHNVRSRKQATSGELHYLTGLIDDISSALSWQTQQVRESDGKFGRMDIH